MEGKPINICDLNELNHNFPSQKTTISWISIVLKNLPNYNYDWCQDNQSRFTLKRQNPIIKVSFCLIIIHPRNHTPP